MLLKRLARCCCEISQRVPEGRCDRSLERSAWQGVPQKDRPLGYGMIAAQRTQRYFSSTCAPCFGFSFHSKLRHSNHRIGAHTCANQTVPYGTALLGGSVPGTSCQATIAPSLRDAFSSSI